MGRIDRVVLHNFKSYNGTHTLGPMTDFTAIIGPNGAGQGSHCILHMTTHSPFAAVISTHLLLSPLFSLSAGKSNILDAISFVMGVRSSHLRGQALSDLIYKPTTIEQEIEADERKDERKGPPPTDEESKEEKTSPTSPARDAFVELVYSLSTDELPLFPAPSRPNDELRFRRSITRAGVSQYRLNDRAMKWEEYSAELEKLGVSVKAKNFLVFQGDVESIAQRTPRQMSDMLDVISGSAALKDEYEKRKEEAERGDEEFLRVVERHSTVKRERLALRKQKEEAEEYQRLVAEEAQHKSDLALWAFYHLCEDQTEKESEKADTQQRLDDKAQERAELEAQVKELQADLARRKRQLTEAEKTLTDRSRRLEKKRPDHIRLREEIRHLRGQISRQEKELEAWQAKRDQQRREVRKLEDDLRRVREELQLVNDTEAKEEEKAREVQLAEADRREYAELRKRLNAAVNELTERRRALLADIKRQRDAIERQLEMVAELRGRRTKEDDIRREMARRAQQLTEQTEEVRRGLEANRKKRAEGERKRGQQAAQKSKMTEELSGLVARLDEASSRSRDNSRQQKAAGMVDVLQRHFTGGGIHGRLSDLVTPSAKKYELPSVIALGRHLDSVVVESERVALDCVEYLREQKMGVATFIPLDSIRVQPLSESLRNLGGSARLLVDVLVFEERFTRALLYAVGSTVVRRPPRRGAATEVRRWGGGPGGGADEDRHRRRVGHPQGGQHDGRGGAAPAGRAALRPEAGGRGQAEEGRARRPPAGAGQRKGGRRAEGAGCGHQSGRYLTAVPGGRPEDECGAAGEEGSGGEGRGGEAGGVGGGRGGEGGGGGAEGGGAGDGGAGHGAGGAEGVRRLQPPHRRPQHPRVRGGAAEGGGGVQPPQGRPVEAGGGAAVGPRV